MKARSHIQLSHFRTQVCFRHLQTIKSGHKKPTQGWVLKSGGAKSLLSTHCGHQTSEVVENCLHANATPTKHPAYDMTKAILFRLSAGTTNTRPPNINRIKYGIIGAALDNIHVIPMKVKNRTTFKRTVFIYESPCLEGFWISNNFFFPGVTF